MEQQLLEIGLYFDERVDPETQQKMSLQDVADKLVVYPLHYFRGKHDLTFPRGAQRDDSKLCSAERPHK